MRNKQKRIGNSQITNFQTYSMYLRQLLTLGENVFQFEGLPEYIDIAYMNKVLLQKGSIAFFNDEVLGLLCLPYTIRGNLDVYGRPVQISVYGANGFTRTLNKDEFVIMYDNNGMYPIYLDLFQYAERLALCTRTIDININQQKTPRMWKTSSEKLKTIQDMSNQVDGFEEKVITFEDINLDDTTVIMAPAPFVADKVDNTKEKLWAEAMRLLGISSVTTSKKERMITSEVQSMQGGTIASRFSRYEPRVRALNLIKEKLGYDIKVQYYDGDPSSIENDFNIDVEEGDVDESL